MFRRYIIAVSALLSALAAPVAAESAGPVALVGDVKQDRVVVENGESRHVLVAPTKVVPGDRLVFTTTYRNNGTKPIENFVVTNPVPPPVAVSDAGDTDVSVDGGAHWGRLAALKVADGKGGERAAEAADITHLRWTISLIAPGAAGTLEYRAVVR